MAMRTLGIGRSLACRAGRVRFAQDVLRAFTARSMATEAGVILPPPSSSEPLSPSSGPLSSSPSSSLVSGSASLESVGSMESMESASPLPPSPPLSPTTLKIPPADPPPPLPFAYRKPPTVLATLYKFPSLEPSRFETFPSSFLFAPLRRDILHRAIVFEGDSHRLGLASTKWRNEVHGSSHKLRPQKGTGRARLGDGGSPMLRGGGRAFGPKPRDFSTKLPRKIYDLAWRTALSYRYRRGQLVVMEDEMDVPDPDPALVLGIMRQNGWGHDDGRSTLVVAGERPGLKEAMKDLGRDGRVLLKEEVDVKDILEMGRIVIEMEALLWFQEEHGGAAV